MASQAGVIKDRLTQCQIVLFGRCLASIRFSWSLLFRRRCCRIGGPLVSMNISIARLIDNRGRVREILSGRFITAPTDDSLGRDENKR
jgi:hypothetical protein